MPLIEREISVAEVLKNVMSCKLDVNGRFSIMAEVGIIAFSSNTMYKLLHYFAYITV